jgi:hypothetical protein
MIRKQINVTRALALPTGTTRRERMSASRVPHTRVTSSTFSRIVGKSFTVSITPPDAFFDDPRRDPDPAMFFVVFDSVSFAVVRKIIHYANRKS